MKAEELIEKLGLTKESVVEAGSRMLYALDSPLTLYQESGGICAVVINRRISGCEEVRLTGAVTPPVAVRHLVTADVMKALGIEWGYVPPIPLMRQAVALAVEAKLHAEKAGWDLGEIWRELDRFKSAEEVLKMPYEDFKAEYDKAKG